MKKHLSLFLLLFSFLLPACGPHQEKDILSYCDGQTKTDFQFDNLTYLLISKSTTRCELDLIKTQFEIKGFPFDFSQSSFAADGSIDHLRLRIMCYSREPFWDIFSGRSFVGGGLEVSREELAKEDYGFMFYNVFTDRTGVSSGRFKNLLRWAEEYQVKPVN